MIYIDNSVDDFRIKDDLKTTSVIAINSVLVDYDTKLIHKWLPNARETDKYEDIYLKQIEEEERSE